MSGSPKPVLMIAVQGSGLLVGTPRALNIDASGNLQVGPPGTPGNETSIVGIAFDELSTNKNGLATLAFGYALNSVTGVWDRIESASAQADGVVPVPLGNTLTIAQMFGFNPVTGNFDRAQIQPNNADAIAAQATGNQACDSFLYGWNGASFDRIRIATISHTVIATALGSTAVWTPTAGKRFRLMGYTIDVAGTLAASGVNTITLKDNATTFKSHLANCIQTPSASISGGADHMGADLGQGYLSTAINQVLNVNLSVAMGSGGVAVNVWGTEE